MERQIKNLHILQACIGSQALIVPKKDNHIKSPFLKTWKSLARLRKIINGPMLVLVVSIVLFSLSGRVSASEENQNYIKNRKTHFGTVFSTKVSEIESKFKIRYEQLMFPQIISLDCTFSKHTVGQKVETSSDCYFKMPWYSFCLVKSKNDQAESLVNPYIMNLDHKVSKYPIFNIILSQPKYKLRTIWSQKRKRRLFMPAIRNESDDKLTIMLIRFNSGVFSNQKNLINDRIRPSVVMWKILYGKDTPARNLIDSVSLIESTLTTINYRNSLTDQLIKEQKYNRFQCFETESQPFVRGDPSLSKDAKPYRPEADAMPLDTRPFKPLCDHKLPEILHPNTNLEPDREKLSYCSGVILNFTMKECPMEQIWKDPVSIIGEKLKRVRLGQCSAV